MRTYGLTGFRLGFGCQISGEEAEIDGHHECARNLNTEASENEAGRKPNFRAYGSKNCRASAGFWVGPHPQTCQKDHPPHPKKTNVPTTTPPSERHRKMKSNVTPTFELMDRRTVKIFQAFGLVQKLGGNLKMYCLRSYVCSSVGIV